MNETIKVDADKIQVNDVLSLTYYVKVLGVPSGDEILVKDLNNGQEILVRGKELIETCRSADQFTKEEKVTKTKAAELLISSTDQPLTVSFVKQDGTERVIRGKLVKPEPVLGRSMVEDLDEADRKNRLRQVDHRTIIFLVAGGTKYTVK